MEQKVYLYTNEILALQSGKDIPPVTCEIDLSNRCMLNCSFCMYTKYREDESTDLDFDVYSMLLKDLKRIGTKSVTFTGGGEPLIHPKATEMIDMAQRDGFNTGLITNGVLLHTIPQELLQNFFFIRVSLDAASSETYLKVKGKNLYDRVVVNIDSLVSNFQYLSCPTPKIGISYVVSKDNCKEISKAKKLADTLEVDYIQFKPAWKNGNIYEDLPIRYDTNMFVTKRYRATDTLPCLIAGLVGIVGANGKLYYCCQHRGNGYYELGDLRIAPFEEIWKIRSEVKPTIDKCPQCRYMNYAKKFSEIPEMLIKHRNFL